MPSPRRLAKPYTGDLSPAALDRMHWGQQSALARAGLITWSDANASTARRVKAANGGRDPYAHLLHDSPWIPDLGRPTSAPAELQHVAGNGTPDPRSWPRRGLPS